MPQISKSDFIAGINRACRGLEQDTVPALKDDLLAEIFDKIPLTELHWTAAISALKMSYKYRKAPSVAHFAEALETVRKNTARGRDTNWAPVPCGICLGIGVLYVTDELGYRGIVDCTCENRIGRGDPRSINHQPDRPTYLDIPEPAAALNVRGRSALDREVAPRYTFGIEEKRAILAKTIKIIARNTLKRKDRRHHIALALPATVADLQELEEAECPF